MLAYVVCKQSSPSAIPYAVLDQAVYFQKARRKWEKRVAAGPTWHQLKFDSNIPLLVEHLTDKLSRLRGYSVPSVSEEVLEQLFRYYYLGNIRELENILEQAMVLSAGKRIDLQHLPKELQPKDFENKPSRNRNSLEAMEKQMIVDALDLRNGSRKKAAADLGIDPSTLYRKMKRFDISA